MNWQRIILMSIETQIKYLIKELSKYFYIFLMVSETLHVFDDVIFDTALDSSRYKNIKPINWIYDSCNFYLCTRPREYGSDYTHLQPIRLHLCMYKCFRWQIATCGYQLSKLPRKIMKTLVGQRKSVSWSPRLNECGRASWIYCKVKGPPNPTSVIKSNHKQHITSAVEFFITLRPRQYGRHFPDDIFKCIFLNENVWILITISLIFFPRVELNNIPALVQIMAWRRRGDKPLSEPMMVSLPTLICVTRLQWVIQIWCFFLINCRL